MTATRLWFDDQSPPTAAAPPWTGTRTSWGMASAFKDADHWLLERIWKEMKSARSW
jgi:hypothetical protein